MVRRRQPALLALLPLALAAACAHKTTGADTGGSGPTDADTDPDPDSDTDSDTTMDAEWPLVWGEPGLTLSGGRVAADGERVWVLGAVAGTWDPGAGPVSTRGDSELLLVCVDQATATVAWAGSVGGDRGFPYPGDVAATGDGGAVFTGWSSLPIDLDPGPGARTHTPTGGQADSFVVKVDEAGALAWSAVFEGSARVEAYDVAASPDGRVVVAGWVHNGTIDLDPGEGEDVQTASGYDAWVASLSADGELEWAGTIPAEDWPGEIAPLRVEVDEHGDAYVIGYFTGAADFAVVRGGAVADAGERKDAFVVKLDAAGEVVWLDTFGGAPNTLPYGAQIDADGVLWLSGYFDEQTDFDPGPGETLIAPVGGYDMFWLQLDTADGALLNVTTLGGALSDVAYSVAVNDAGDFMLDGQFTGPTDFDPTDGVLELTAEAPWTGFVGLWGSDGAPRWIAQGSATTGDIVGQGDHFWVTGTLYEPDTDLAFGAEEDIRSATGEYDLVLWRVGAPD